VKIIRSFLKTVFHLVRRCVNHVTYNYEEMAINNSNMWYELFPAALYDSIMNDTFISELSH
jgi:hypothetical protein